MPSRRFRMPSLRLRSALPSRLPGLPRAARPPVALTLVGGIAAAVVVTGHPVSAAHPVAAQQPAATTTVAAERVSVADTLADGAVVARALGALAAPGERDPGHASRSHARQPLQHRHQAPAHRWVRPNYGPLTSGFGYRWGRLHAGIDLAGPYGSPIVAATDGCITFAGYEDGYGQEIRISDWDGTETLYGHMSAFVRTGGCVKAGQVIGRLGSTGNVTGPHLHFEVHVGGTPVNPISFLAKRHLYI
jgi:murein DD-endopeptidase MepM/ murein hydrolase activator NlpD